MGCCKNCLHWQGRGNIKYADCYMVIAELIPNFLSCFTDCGYEFTVPFDPHEVKYYLNSVTFKQLHSKLQKLKLKEEIRKDKVRTVDYIFDSLGRAYMKTVSLIYLQTRRDYKCSYYKERGYQ